MCEYCKQEMQGKSIENRYSIETMVDDVFLYNWCECGRHTVVEIKYCPMCGEKLENKCKWLCDEVCCNDKCEYLADYPPIDYCGRTSTCEYFEEEEE